MPAKKQGKNGKKTNHRNPRRKAFTQQIQLANLKPSTALVRFQGKQKYQCLLQTGANAKSMYEAGILKIDLAFEPVCKRH